VRERDGWITKEELNRGFEAAGIEVRDRQLERWRNEGLLPDVCQQSDPRVGSTVYFPSETVAHVRAITRIGPRKGLDYVGQAMWLAGFDVDQRHWAPQIEKADRLARRAAPIVRFLTRRLVNPEHGETFGEAVVPLLHLVGPLGKMARRLTPDELPRAANVLVEIASGEFSDFYASASERDAVDTESVFLNAFDFDKGQGDHIFGKRLILDSALGGALGNISEAMVLSPLDITQAEVLAARNDVRNGLKIAVCLHEGLKWIFSDTALGLRFAAWFARTVPANVIFLMALGFARLRQSNQNLLPSHEIARMADVAERIWLMSSYFRDLYAARPDLGYLIGPARMKLSFSSRHEHEKLLEDLKCYPFPEPRIRPWESWQKLSKKMMSPGLLAMSIGAPDQISNAALVAGANGPPIP